MVLRLVSCALGAMLAAVVVGCVDDTSTPDSAAPDGGPDSGEDGGVDDPPPNIPWLADGVPPIMLAPCPEGWREVVVNGVSECDPYPEGGPATCGAGDAHFPGEPGCRPIGETCPAGDYAGSLPTPLPTDGSVIYVKAGAAGGGDGSVTAPYATLAEVPWTLLSPGTTVALAKGTYPGTLQVNEGVRVLGACVQETRVTGDTGPELSVVTAVAGVGEARVENLTIGDAAQVGLGATGGQTITLEGVLIEGTHTVGVWASNPGSVVTLRDTIIRDVEPQAATGSFGRGINVEAGARLTATRLVVERCHELGVYAAEDGAAVNLTDTVVRETRPQGSNDANGRGIGVQQGAQFTATRLLVQSNLDVGVIAIGEATVLDLTDSVIRDTRPRASDETGGRGISIQRGAQLSATRLLAQGNHELGLYAYGAGTTVSLVDAVIRDTEPQVSDGSSGRSISVQEGAQLSALRFLAQSSHDTGVFIDGDATAVTLTDALVRDIAPRASDDTLGRGIQVQLGAHLDGERLVVEDSHEFGMLATTASAIDVRDVTVTRVTRAACASTTCPDLVYGHGVAAASSSVSLTRFQVRDADTCGVFLAETESNPAPTNLDLESGVVSETQIGACIQVDGYDTARLSNDVEYRDNGTNLDSTSLPVPGASSSASP